MEKKVKCLRCGNEIKEPIKNYIYCICDNCKDFPIEGKVKNFDIFK